jgi:hypothetical chaperone protein
MSACGLDFGTSNSAIGIVGPDRSIALAPVEGGDVLIPSAIFFDFSERDAVQFGRTAIESYIAQHEGRLMRALKSVLGSSLIDEQTALRTKRIALVEVVELFVRHLKLKAEEAADAPLEFVVHGRPVRFVDNDDKADAKAEATLARIAQKAGFREVTFVYEPIAAAYNYEETANREELVLVADIGGGTSDFTIVRIGPERRQIEDRKDDILGNSGVRVGGTDFDRHLSFEAVMPLLGLGTQLVEKDLPMPRGIYVDLATWATINFIYRPKTVREIHELFALAEEPKKVGRLLATATRHLGHRIAFSVEDGKIALSDTEAVQIPLTFVEPGLDAATTRKQLEAAIQGEITRLETAIEKCLQVAGVKGDAVQTVFVTGGTARVPAVRHTIARLLPDARFARGDDFLSVALGLTRAAQRRYG